ncbi:MAG: 2-amino-4-hydroxy-6-hydroxymethyldihydropteridine diphosphokinase [Planctomycetota bacterium]
MMRPAPVEALIALGSNLGDRRAHLDAAVDALRHAPGIELMAVSSYHETVPQGGPPQGLYLNAALLCRTALEPDELLGLLLRIERSRGRVRSVRNGPRVLDLDLVLYGEEAVQEPSLEVPHPRAHERLFVLEPAAEVAPHLRHPLLGQTVRELLAGLRARQGSVSYRGERCCE